MSENLNRRKFLSIATSVTSAVGGIFALGAFVSTFQPSKKAKALGASIKVNLSKLEPGSNFDRLTLIDAPSAFAFLLG